MRKIKRAVTLDQPTEEVYKPGEFSLLLPVLLEIYNKVRGLEEGLQSLPMGWLDRIYYKGGHQKKS